MKFSKLIFPLLVLIFLGCNDNKDEPVPTAIILTITDLEGQPLADNLKADLNTRIRLTAILPNKVDEANRIVTFKTETGTLDTNADDKTSRDVTAVFSPDSSRYLATTILTVGAVPGEFIVSATIKSKSEFNDQKSISLAPTEDDEVIGIQPTEASSMIIETLPANGLTKLDFEASVNIQNGTHVKFETTTGEFIGTFDPPTTAVVALGGGRNAEISLTVGKDPGNHFVTATLLDEGNELPFVSEYNFTLDTLFAADIIDLTITPETGLTANGIDVTEVAVVISNSSAKTINLKAEGGEFISPLAGPQIDLPLDKNGMATSTFRAGLISGDAAITASLSDGSNFNIRRTFDLDPISDDDVITSLTTDLSSGTVRADGSTIITLSADIANTVADEVTFSVTDGTGTFLGTNQSIEKVTISNNQASAQLQVGTTAGIAYINAKIETDPEFSVTIPFELLTPLSSDFFTLDLIGTDNLVADGTSQFQVRYNQVSTLAQSATVTLNRGNFIGGVGKTKTFTPGEIGIAEVELEPTTYFVTGKISDALPSSVLSFDVGRAYPSDDGLALDPNSFQIDSASTEGITISILTERSPGKPSAGTIIDFIAFQTTESNEVGRFSPLIVETDSNGEASVQFITDKQNPAKGIPITIRATVARGTDPELTEEISITVKE